MTDITDDKPKRSVSRRDFVKISGAAALGFAGINSQQSSTARTGTGKPNILVILTDQQHIDSIRAAGCTDVMTPAMDQLVEQGVHFTESYSTNPVCSPARSSIVTGRMSTETGVYTNGKRIRRDIPNIGQWFSEQSDYECVYAGKWHVPRTHQKSIQGFRVLTTGIGGHGILGDTSTSRACEGYIKNRSDSNPFLMIASFLQPHDICEWLRLNTFLPEGPSYPIHRDKLPELPPNFEYDTTEPAYLKRLRETREGEIGKWTHDHWRYYRWSYYRHIEMVDGEIGRLLDALDDTGQIDNTIILLTSDHGEGMGHHQTVRKSLPYDEAAKVPLIVSYPGQIRKNIKDRNHLVSGVDIVPTLCDFAGLKAPAHMRGKSLRPILEGKQVAWHDFVVTELPGDRARMIRTKRYKYIAYRDDPVDMLFDREKDPGETVNQAANPAYASAVRDHRKLLTDWEKTLDVVPDLPGANAWWRQG
ncbi:hypothetical protein BVY01_01790 [bacterium I07]|nr:hypothetical protein BVY01_01790 [bacterium I07]